MVNQVLTGAREDRVMRRLAACLILSLALAAPAVARDGRIAVDAPVQDAGLRGAVGLAPPATEEATPLPFAAPTRPAAVSTIPSSASQCRTTCSQLYYFCLAGEDERCPQNWSRCVSGCRS